MGFNSGKINGYVTDVDFLPPYDCGEICVDTSALCWVTSYRSFPITKGESDAKFQRLSGFNKVFANRGGISTSYCVFSEIEGNIRYWNNFNGNKKKAKSFEKAREFEKVCEILSEGRGLEDIGIDANYKNEVVGIISRRFPIGVADRSIITYALLKGNNTGLLSADRKMIEGWEWGVRRFGLKGCFVSHAIQARSYLVR